MSDLVELYEVIARCPDCELSATRTRAVPGEGPENAQIMFIGEGPGFNEDKSGRPFVGAAGQFLDKLLASIDLRRADVSITNVVKCRPPNNRDPLPGEIEACRKYLDRQIALIRPKVVVTLGRYSMGRWFPGASISRIHGQPKVVDGMTIVPMFHPAAALHQERYRALIQEDFLRLPSILERALASAVAAAPAPVADASAVAPSSIPPPTAAEQERTAEPVTAQQMRLL
ncbi:MAG: uracil-DNA glycosylase [Dehalococcoidia bacterium]